MKSLNCLDFFQIYFRKKVKQIIVVFLKPLLSKALIDVKCSKL